MIDRCHQSEEIVHGGRNVPINPKPVLGGLRGRQRLEDEEVGEEARESEREERSEGDGDGEQCEQGFADAVVVIHEDPRSRPAFQEGNKGVGARDHRSCRQSSRAGRHD